MPIIHKAALEHEQRTVFFQTSEEGVEDREGEDIAADALWRSREMFVQQGNFDINHFSWLGNPYGTGARPEYVIGRPLDVRRDKARIYVKGEIFNSRDSGAALQGLRSDGPELPSPGTTWADWFWHSLTELEPAMRWFPSVFGKILPGGTTTKTIKGRKVRFITNLEWYSVGFAQRAQHPTLPYVDVTPLDHFAKAVLDVPRAYQQGVMVLDYSTFAKALSVGVPTTDSAKMTGPQAVAPESLEGKPFEELMPRVIKRILNRRVLPKRPEIVKAFRTLGCDPATAAAYAERLLQMAAERLGGGRRKLPHTGT